MATNNQLSFNLDLDLLPDINNIPVKAYAEFVNLYNSVRLLASALDAYTGNEFRSQDIQDQLVGEDLRTTVVVENFASFYLKFAEAAVYGNLIGVNTAGQGKLASYDPITFSNGTTTGTFWYSNCVGYLAQDSVAAGEIGRVSYQGIIGVSGAVRNNLYLHYNAHAFGGANGQLTGGRGTNYSVNLQPVGTGIIPESIFYQGSI